MKKKTIEIRGRSYKPHIKATYKKDNMQTQIKKQTNRKTTTAVTLNERQIFPMVPCIPQWWTICFPHSACLKKAYKVKDIQIKVRCPSL